MLYLFSKKGRLAHQRAKELYSKTVKHARRPIFYAGYEVADTVEGRFEMIALHCGLLVTRLCRADMGEEGRLLGVGDLGVPRRIKKMMASFKGRAFAYDEAIKSGDGEIRHALIRNLYAANAEQPRVEVLGAMSAYIQACVLSLNAQGLSDLWQGCVHFADIENLKQGPTVYADQAA
jgi:cytochrome b pre-mRNA-processing protein 3